MHQKRSVAFHTLGCKLNFSETSTLSRMLENEGFEKKDFNDTADVYVINTCSVTDNADKECRMLVRRIQRKAPESVVVITGCYAQLKPQQIAEIEGVDLVLGAAEKFNIAQHLREFTKGDSAKICSCEIEEVTGFNASFSQNDRTRTFLKVQDGCDYTCAFCTIPLARGKSRSDRVANVVRNVTELATTGVKEVVLTGVNLGDFGKGPEGSKKNEETFFDLIKALEQVQGIERYRISSIEPNLLTNEIIEFVANSDKFMPHFHIPLQSGSNTVLGLMKRRYRRELYAERVKLIKTLMPHCAIGVDVIVGFPGETEEAFAETVNFLHELDVSYLHVFTYSERPNTAAIEMADVIAINTRNDRNKKLRNLSFMKMSEHTRRHIGQTRKVLFEIQNKSGMMEGYTDNYIKINIPHRPDWVNQGCAVDDIITGMDTIENPLKKYIVTISFFIDDDFMSFVQPHRTYINYLINKGIIDSYAVSMESYRTWIMMSAKTKEEVAGYLQKSPLFHYWTYQIDELFVYDGQTYRLPALQMN